MNIFTYTLPKNMIEANRAFYIAALKHLFLERGRLLTQTTLLRREVDGRLDRYSKTVYVLSSNGMEPAYYNFDINEWVRAPKNMEFPLIIDRYIEAESGLDTTIKDLVFEYLIGNIRVTDVSYRTSHIFK